MNIFTVIEKNIRDVASQRGMPLNELILKIDMTEGGFYKMLKSGSMKVKTLELISEVLNYPMAGFLGSEKPTVPDRLYQEIEPEVQYLKEPLAEYKKENEVLRDKVEILTNALNDKEKIIELLSK